MAGREAQVKGQKISCYSFSFFVFLLPHFFLVYFLPFCVSSFSSFFLFISIVDLFFISRHTVQSGYITTVLETFSEFI
jgi:hypothetical protein